VLGTISLGPQTPVQGRTSACKRRPIVSASLQLSRELLPAATRRENQELKTDAPSGHGLAAALDIC
jgi:hypothetical protein